MLRAPVPASPDQDIEARRSWRGPTLGDSALTADLAAFCESGVSVNVASAQAVAAAPGETPFRPVIAPGLGCRVSPEGRVRVLVWSRVTEPVLAALAAGAQVAVTLSRPYTHRSIQLKAAAATLSAATAEDEAEARRQAQGFADELVSVGYRSDFAATYVTFLPGELVAIDLVPDRVFVQTPGPRAGAALVPE